MNPIDNVCEYLSGRKDKNFLGCGDVACALEPDKARILFVQRWWEGGVLDAAAGNVAHWAPDHILLDETDSTPGMAIEGAIPRRTVFMALDNVLGLVLTWENKGHQPLRARFSLSGRLMSIPKAAAGNAFIAPGPFNDWCFDTIHQAIAFDPGCGEVQWDLNAYRYEGQIEVPPGECAAVRVALGVDVSAGIAGRAARWVREQDPIETNRDLWNRWFRESVPAFTCSDPFIERLYYYRWWSMLTKMIFARVGHFLHPAPREGTLGFNAVISYSGAGPSIDEVRWMRKPDWAFSTLREFFAPENLFEGHLTSAIFAHTIGNDTANVDQLGHPVPYHNYAVAALRDAMLLHPEAGEECLREIWPCIKTHLESYSRLFDIDKDGLYETYPNSDPSGQEWGMRFVYFDPIPELVRDAWGYGYCPDESTAEQDMALAAKIRASCLYDPDLAWPRDAAEFRRIYYGTRDHRLASLDQTTYAHRDFLAAACFAEAMGEPELAWKYAAKAEQSRVELLKRMWNARDQFFYDVQPITMKQTGIKSPTGYYAFWARMAGPEHLGMFKWLYDPGCFWTNFPVATLPLDFPRYREVQESGWTYWNYWTWPRTTCHVVDAAALAAKEMDRERIPQAAELFRRYTRMHFIEGDLERPCIAERYDPHTAEPKLEWLDYNHSTWLDLVFKHLAGVDPSEDGVLHLRPLEMGVESFSFEGIRIRGHEVNVTWTRDQGYRVCIDGMEHGKREEIGPLDVELYKL